MAIINYINTGSGVNSGDGDSLRTAFTKINQNFDSLVSNFVAAGVTSWNGQVGIVNFTNQDLLNLLGFTPYNSTNPEGYVTSSTIALLNYAPLDYVNTSFVFVSDLAAYNFASTTYVDLKLTEYPTLAYLDNQQYLTSISLPNFLTNYVTLTDLGNYGNELRNYTTSTVFNAVNNSSLIPSIADVFNLGDESYRWSTLYLSNAVYIQGIGISVDPTTGRLLVDGNDIVGGFLLNETGISKTNQSSFYISNTDTAGPSGTSNSWIFVPGESSAPIQPLALYNTGTSGISLTGGATSLFVTNNGVFVQGNMVLPLRLKGTQYVSNGFTYGNHYLDVRPNAWLRTFYDEDIVVPQSIVSYTGTNYFAPLNLKGNVVSLISNTATDETRELDIAFSGMLAVSQDGIFIGLTDTEGSGNPINSDSTFKGYRLPLTRGSNGQILAITSKGADLDTLSWVTPSGGAGLNLTSLSSSLIPSTNLAYDLGSTSSQWRSLYVGTSTIYLGGTALSVAGGSLTINGSPLSGGAAISLAQLKTIIAASTDFADFKSRIASL